MQHLRFNQTQASGLMTGFTGLVYCYLICFRKLKLLRVKTADSYFELVWRKKAGWFLTLI